MKVLHCSYLVWLFLGNSSLAECSFFSCIMKLSEPCAVGTPGIILATAQRRHYKTIQARTIALHSNNQPSHNVTTSPEP